MKRYRTHAAVVAALSLVLSVAGTTLAADPATQSGNTSETLEVPYSISLTVPASIAYPGGKNLNSASVALTGISTDSAGGMTIKMKVNAGGAGKITPGSRQTGSVSTTGTGLVGDDGATPAEMGNATTDAGAWTLATASGPVSSGSTATFMSRVDASAYAPGSYTGTLTFTATTLP